MSRAESHQPATVYTLGLSLNRRTTQLDTKSITAANREAWEEAAPRHRAHNQQRLLEAFSEPGFVCFDEHERRVLAEVTISGKDVAQVCCNNGRELLSVKNMGAARCVGFDSASGFIEQAVELAAAAGLPCEFECCDAYAIDPRFDANFDLVVITIGVVSWMPDLDGFLRAVVRLLRPGGQLFINEQHPILDMVEPGGADAPVRFDYSYFNTEPFVENDGLDYYGGESYASKTKYSFHYTLADVITAGLDAGMLLETFREYPQHISNTWFNVEKQGPRLPMSYLLVFRHDVR